MGRLVENFKAGDRVASVHNKGGMAEYVEIPGDRLGDLFKLPDSFNFITAATLEPMCNPMHSYHLLISHTLPLSDAAEGFALQANPAESMKVIITMK